MDRYRTSIWEAVGLSEIRKTRFDEDEDSSGIEERLPAATISGSSFYTGGSSKDESLHTPIDIGDSSYATSRRHEVMSTGNFDTSRSRGQGYSTHYNGSVAISAERGGGYAVVPTNNKGVDTATISRTSKYNTTFVNGVPVERTYENTTVVRDHQGRIIDKQTQHSQLQNFADVTYSGASGGSSQPYPVPVAPVTHHFSWDAPSSGKQEQHYDNRVEETAHRNQQESQYSYGQANANQYYDRNGHVVGGYQNKQDREFHTGGQDVRGYGGNERRYDQEQLSAAVGGQRQQSAIENAAAGHGFRTNVINIDGGGGKNFI